MKRLGARGARIHGEWLHRWPSNCSGSSDQKHSMPVSAVKVESVEGPSEFNLFPQRTVLTGVIQKVMRCGMVTPLV
jgi:hypothetical protein